MTKQEKTGIRDLFFSQWIRNNLPDSSTGFLVTDIDFVLSNYKSKKIMILEVKCFNGQKQDWQDKIYNFIANCIKNGKPDDWTFYGYHFIQFENNDFSGKCFLDGKEISEAELKKFLSMENEPVLFDDLFL